MKVIKTTLQHNNKRIRILSIYKSPTIKPEDFNISFHNHIKYDTERADIELIVGYINIDIMDDSDVHSQHYLNILAEEGYISGLNKYTRSVGMSNSCINHIFIKTHSNRNQIIPIVLHQKISDHYPTMMRFTLPETSDIKKIRNHIKQFIDYKKLKEILEKENWSEVYSEGNIE